MDKIYKLIDPNTKEIKYIGKTWGPLLNRLAGHIHHAFILTHGGDNKHKKWIRGLLKNRQVPIIKTLHKVKTKTWQYWEIYYIEKYKKMGCELTNIAPGGGGHHLQHTERAIEKMTKANFGRYQSQEAIDKMVKAALEKATLKRTTNNYPVIATNIITGEIRHFRSSNEAFKTLTSEGVRTSARRIRQCIQLSKTQNGKYLRKSSGGYTWDKFIKP